MPAICKTSLKSQWDLVLKITSYYWHMIGWLALQCAPSSKRDKVLLLWYILMFFVHPAFMWILSLNIEISSILLIKDFLKYITSRVFQCISELEKYWSLYYAVTANVLLQTLYSGIWCSNGVFFNIFAVVYSVLIKI